MLPGFPFCGKLGRVKVPGAEGEPPASHFRRVLAKHWREIALNTGSSFPFAVGCGKCSERDGNKPPPLVSCPPPCRLTFKSKILRLLKPAARPGGTNSECCRSRRFKV